tara:strand:+ start:413795 stop:414169 length:375 start_codon:yes stop_codon:yes gene_type:complete
MNLRRRFSLFGIGFAAGIVIVLFVLNGKNASCNYFPNARMLEILRNKERVYSDEALDLLRNENIDSMEVVKLFSNGDIDFSKSKVRQEPCRYYWIDGFLQEKEASIYVQNCDTLITIQKIYLNQ